MNNSKHLSIALAESAEKYVGWKVAQESCSYVHGLNEKGDQWEARAATGRIKCMTNGG